jgi:hypothetical protein
MWWGRFSSPQLEHSFGFAAESESCARRLLRRDLETLFCWTAMSGAFVGSGLCIMGANSRVSIDPSSGVTPL